MRRLHVSWRLLAPILILHSMSHAQAPRKTDCSFEELLKSTCQVGAGTTAASGPEGSRGWGDGSRVNKAEISPSDGTTAALASAAIALSGGRPFVVVDDRTAFSMGIADDLMKRLKASDANARVTREFVSDKANDFTSSLNRIREVGAGVVVFFANDVIAGQMARQMHQQGVKAHIVLPDLLCNATWVRITKGVLDENNYSCLELE